MKKEKIIDFMEMFSISYTALRINGSHPSIPRNATWFLHFLILHGAFTVGLCLGVYNVYLNFTYGDYFEACRHCTLPVIYFVISFQYLVLLINQKCINILTSMIKADFTRDMPEDAREIMFVYARRGKKVCIQWLMISISVMCALMAKHIFLELYTYVTDDWKLLHLFPMTYPAPVEQYKQHPIVYIILYLSIMYYVFYGATMYTGFVPLGPIFMLHACGQLEIVKKRTLTLYEGNKTTEKVEAQLKHIVKHMQYIYSFVDYIKEAYEMAYELTIKSTTIALPLTLFQILEALKHGELSVEFIILFFGAIFFISGPCYFSDKLMEKGEEVRLAIYSCGWETRYDSGVRKTLLVSLLRTTQPIAVRTVFSTVCLDTLANVFHQSYALFNLMNAAV